MDDVEIRLAQDAEFAQIAGLRWTWIVDERQGTPDATRDEFVLSFVDWVRANSAAYECWVAVRGPQVIGMAWWLRVPRVPSPRAFTRTTADVQSVFVLPADRGAGIGGRLIAAVVAAGAGSGAERMTVHASQRAVSAYQRAGFESAEVLRQVDLEGVRNGASKSASPGSLIRG